MKNAFFIFILSYAFLASCKNSSVQNADLQYRQGSPDEIIRQWADKQWQKSPNGYLNTGFSDTTWWISTSYQNTSATDRKMLLILNSPHLNQVKAYRDGQLVPFFSAGDVFPFDERPFKDHDLVIPLEIKAKDTVDLLLWVEKKGESMQLQLQWIDEVDFPMFRSFSSMIMGLILGWLLLIIVFCLILWHKTPDLTHIWYAFYVLSLTMWIVTNWGWGYQFLWPDSPAFTNMARPFFLLLAMLFFSMTLLYYFGRNEPMNRIKKLLYINIILIVLMLISMFMVDNLSMSNDLKKSYLILYSFLILFTLFLAFLQITRHWKKSPQQSNYLLAGILFLILTGLALDFMQFGLVFPYQHFINTYGTSISMLGETTIIAYGLADRFNSYRLEKERLSMQLIEQQHILSEQLITVQEKERAAIGRDVHDSLGGLLSALKMSLGKFSKENPTVTTGKLDELVARSINEVRSITQDLVPPNLHEYGLEKSIWSHVELLRETTALEIIYYYNVETELSINMQTVIYRICNELIGNAIRHSGGTEISLQLIEDDGKLQIIAEDNGIGFQRETQSDGFGLKNLEYRVAYFKGTLNIDSNEQGTTVIVEIPLPDKNEET